MHRASYRFMPPCGITETLSDVESVRVVHVPDLAFDKAMRRRISDLQKATRTKYAIHSTLITTYDVEDNSYCGNIQSIVTGEDLFR